MTPMNEIPKRVMVTRVAMCGGGTSYDVYVPVKYVNNYDGCRYTTICRDNGGKFVELCDALVGEAHYAMPLGWDRYQDKLDTNKAAEPIAYRLAVSVFPELEKIGKVPILWATGLISPEFHMDVLLDTRTMKPVATWLYNDGKPVKQS